MSAYRRKYPPPNPHAGTQHPLTLHIHHPRKMEEPLRFPRRPGFGTSGRSLQVRTNFFPVLSLPGQNIHHYEVTITPEANPRTNRRLYTLWEELNRNGILKNTRPVFDGRRYIFAPRGLLMKDDAASFSLELGDEVEEGVPQVPM